MTQGNNHNPKKILIVDDEPSFLDLLKSRLESSGYSVTSASNGEEALALIMSEKPDMAILDICMPKMDGVELATKLRQNACFKTLPIVFLTALHQKVEEKKVGSHIGSNTVFAKPFDEQQLMSHIAKVCGN